MDSQAECESCFRANVLIFTYIFRCSGKRHCLNGGMLDTLESFAKKSDSVAAF